LTLAPVGAYATFVEPARLVTEEVTVPLDPGRAGSEPIRVAVLADIQSCEVTERLREAVRRAMDFEPHVILLPGDLMQCERVAARERGIPEFRRLLAPLDAPLGVWFVMGNTDRQSTVLRVLEGTNVQLLRDETRLLTRGGRRVLLAGADFAARSEGFVRGLARERPGDVLLLFAHYPDVIHFVDPAAEIDLIVAGHTHGGQVVLPFFGPPITLSSVPRRVAAGGLHEVEGARIYVSRGIGAERASAPLVRFNCPPEVSLLTLE
jgi:predicted MPP superfamily phosphohydrolase